MSTVSTTTVNNTTTEHPVPHSNSAWDKFYRLSTLSITFAHSTAGTAYIYGNGRNQVAVSVSLKIVDRAGNKIGLTEDDIYNAIYLCDYNTGEETERPEPSPDSPIIPRAYSPWSYSRYANEFHNAISYQSASVFGASEAAIPAVQDNLVDTFALYKSCPEEADGKLISVGVSVPGVGNFDTSRNGTATINAPAGNSGSVFKSPSAAPVISGMVTGHTIRY